MASLVEQWQEKVADKFGKHLELLIRQFADSVIEGAGGMSGRARLAGEGRVMGDVVYRSVVQVDRGPGALRYAAVPAEDAPVVFGVHGEVAAHYGRREGDYEPHATTLDYVVAAAAG